MTSGPPSRTSRLGNDPIAVAAESAAAVDVANLQGECLALQRRCLELEKSHEHQRAVIGEMRSVTAMLAEQLSQNQSDLAYTQQQLEFVVVSLERERGVVADHTEQLRLFAGESSRRGGLYADAYGTETTTLLFVLAKWLYRPVVHLAKGIYTVLSPIIHTVQSLSLFNSEVSQRFSEVKVRTQWDMKSGDLLGRLQKGSLDPLSANTKK